MLNQSQKDELTRRRGYQCEYCDKRVTSATSEIHHMNRKPNDDRPENLKVACRDCHDKITARFR